MAKSYTKAGNGMRKIKEFLSELISKNKEELLKDRKVIAEIEKRIEEKYTKN